MPAARTKRVNLSVRPLRASDWRSVEELFGERGACGGCWCMAWRLPGREWEKKKGASNKRAFKRLVTSNRAQGCLAFAEARPVGWISVGPRGDFRALETKRSLATDWDEQTWSVTCFFVRRDWRGQGVAGKLLEGALKLARASGAKRVEGYPVVPSKSFGAKLPAAFAWTGVPQLFRRKRFREMSSPPGKRPIFWRNLRPRRHP